MALLPAPDPQLFRAVAKPANLPASEVAQARPVYIDGLVPASVVDALADRVAALEAAAAGAE